MVALRAGVAAELWLSAVLLCVLCGSPFFRCVSTHRRTDLGGAGSLLQMGCVLNARTLHSV